MASHLSHTIGAPDGSPGLPIANWSKEYGDLRVAHFVGIHALQTIPLFGYFVAKKNRTIQLFAGGYFIFAVLLYIQALREMPLLR